MPDAETSSRQCPRCGKPAPVNARFCAECGLKLAAGGVVGVNAAKHPSDQGRSGTWLVLGIVALGVALACFALTQSALIRRNKPMETHRMETISRTGPVSGDVVLTPDRAE